MLQTLTTLDPAALRAFLEQRHTAIDNVSARFAAEFAELYERFGERGREACREDISFTIDFLRPVLEFGLLQPFIDYIHWFRDVLEARAIPGEHISLLLQWMEEFYRQNQSPEAAQIIASVLAEGRAALSRTSGALESIERHMPDAWKEYRALKSALLDGDHRQSMRILQQHINRGESLLDVEIHLLQPALYEVGHDWQAKRVSVAQEHLATATATTVMAQLSVAIEPPAPIGAKVLLACVEGNRHAVGLRMVADGFEQRGWAVRFLGADVPVPALVEQVMQWSPDLVGLSVSMPYQIRSVRDTLERLRVSLGESGPALIIGGLAVNSLPAIANQFGIPAAVDAGAAMDAAQRLIERRA